jgi:hypothetical protein
MTDQEIFDTVTTFLLKQGVQSINPGEYAIHQNACLYRGPNGAKCAIGCLIPDTLYTSDIEGTGIREFINPELKNFLGLSVPARIEFLEELQYTHDHCFNSIEMLKKHLRFTAHAFNLKTDVLDAHHD